MNDLYTQEASIQNTCDNPYLTPQITFVMSATWIPFLRDKTRGAVIYSSEPLRAQPLPLHIYMTNISFLVKTI